MPYREANGIRKINHRRVILVTLISALLVILIWLAVIMENNLAVTFRSITGMHKQHPFYFIIDLLPVFIYILLYTMYRIMNRAIMEFDARSRRSQSLFDKNTTFAQMLSEGDDPEIFDKMIETDLGRSLRMIQLNIKSNRRRENEQTWITEGKDTISKILRIYNNLDELAYNILKQLNNYVHSVQGAMYIYDEENKSLINISTYAYNRKKFLQQEIRIGEGLVGQCAYEMDYVYRTEIPEDYMTITTGLLGDRKPRSLVLIPLITNKELQGVMEFAFMDERIPKLSIQFLLELGEIIARTLFNLKVNIKTEKLLEESRMMTGELRNNELKLQEGSQEMESTQKELQATNTQLEIKIGEANNARNRLHWLLENASEIISIYNKDLTLTYISPSVNKILGYSSEEMMNGKDFERIGRSGATGLKKTFDMLLEDPERVIDIEYTFIKRDGERIYLNSSCQNLLTDLSIKGFVLNTRDITESKKVEKEQRLKTRMQSLSENSLDLILRISITGTVYYANPIVEDYTNLVPAILLNKLIDDIPFEKKFREFLNETINTVKENPRKRNTQISMPINLGDMSSDRVMSFDAIPEFQEDELETILFVGHDITEAKRIEKEIKIKNRKIQDSINYAERIQSSILPKIKKIRSAFPKSFVFYQPRDVISGDFPWLFETKEAYFIAAVDCTGHGVPGALLSFVGFFLLNNITGLNPGFSAGELCDELHREVRRALKQDRSNPETHDGMDIALCKFHKNENLVEFAGAHRPLLHLSEGELTLYKGDRKAIGGLINRRKKEEPFVNQLITCRHGDKIFFFSDGLTDQMGGEKGLKYGSVRVREILLENAGLTLHQIEEFFKSDFNNWMGEERQLDDVILIGIEI